MSDAITVFDRTAVRRHRDRAAPRWPAYSFLHEETAARLADRLDDVNRSFPHAVDLGGRDGLLARHLRGRKGIEVLVSTDLSPAFAATAPAPSLACDEELLPFAPQSLDLIASNLALHWVNDLPGMLVQARTALRPDGLFLACMLGGDTLHELRTCLSEAEIDLEGGLSPRVSPFADVRDLGMLLQRAGFALPTIDSDRLTVTYETPLKLLADLRGMGETNAVAERRKGFTRRETLMHALALYQERYGGDDGLLPATFQVIWLTAWAPSPDQPQPKRRGSATVRLADALGTEEIGLDERPGND